MQRILCLFVLAVVVALAPAMADTWQFSFASASAVPLPISGSGTLDTNTVGLPGIVVGLNGTFTLAGTSGFTDSMSLLAPGAFASNDNKFVGPTQYFTINGLSFESGGYNWNIFYAQPPSGTGGYVYTGCPVNQTCGTRDPTGVPSTPINFQATQVPDGGMTLTLLGAVLVGLETLRRKLSV